MFVCVCVFCLTTPLPPSRQVLGNRCRRSNTFLTRGSWQCRLEQADIEFEVFQFGNDRFLLTLNYLRVDQSNTADTGSVALMDKIAETVLKWLLFQNFLKRYASTAYFYNKSQQTKTGKVLHSFIYFVFIKYLYIETKWHPNYVFPTYEVI